MFNNALSFYNFRSIKEQLTLPFSRKVTLLVGPNNIGKSNVVRLLSIVFNGEYGKIDNTFDFSDTNKEVRIDVDIKKSFMLARMVNRNSAISHISNAQFDSVRVSYSLSKDKLSPASDNNHIFSVINRSYFASSDFQSDFGHSSSDKSANLSEFLAYVSPLAGLGGTTYLPNIRFITEEGHEPKQFSKSNFAGETIAFGKVISTLSFMDRPPFEEMFTQNERMRHLCEFIKYCLDRTDVTIQVPNDRASILIGIDGQIRPLASLGTGIEQILMIGLSSTGFPGRLVLIDEPELHLHPTAQRRIMKYLTEQVDAQFVMATHSAAILDSVDADIIQLTTEGKFTTSTTISSHRERYRAVRDLGHSVSDLVQTRYAIWVEGPSDRIYINHWISILDNSLVEGIDYSILFYGGRILSQHSFEDVENDLVKAISFCRAFAVVIDSDRKPSSRQINATKERVHTEVEQQGGLCWITAGREIENYIPIDIVRAIAAEMPGVTPPATPFSQVIKPKTANKVEFARKAISLQSDLKTLDLLSVLSALVARIHAAR